MGDRERTDGSGTRWCARYPRATVHHVAVENIPANKIVPGITEHAGYSTNASQKPKHQIMRPYTDH